jgi:hypothetical protein
LSRFRYVVRFVTSSTLVCHVIETGLDLTGEVQGRLHGRFPTDATSCDWSTNSFRSTHCGSALRLFGICWDATAVILAR